MRSSLNSTSVRDWFFSISGKQNNSGNWETRGIPERVPLTHAYVLFWKAAVLKPVPCPHARPSVNNLDLGVARGAIHKNTSYIPGRISRGCNVGLEECAPSGPVTTQDCRGWPNVPCVTPLLPRQGEQRRSEAAVTRGWQRNGLFGALFLKAMSSLMD